MNNLTENPSQQEEVATKLAGINMASLCRTLVRVLVRLEEKEYSDETQQNTVLKHDVLPDPASEGCTHEA
ncbi:MAG: hypothetical protein KJ064_27565 [Anaerolineae bacterium]|nr:hypothetical protein [Anaerolineae bacterium]